MMKDDMIREERAEFIAHFNERFSEMYRRFDRVNMKTYRIQRALLGVSDALTQQNYLQ